MKCDTKTQPTKEKRAGWSVWHLCFSFKQSVSFGRSNKYSKHIFICKQPRVACRKGLLTTYGMCTHTHKVKVIYSKCPSSNPGATTSFSHHAAFAHRGPFCLSNLGWGSSLCAKQDAFSVALSLGFISRAPFSRPIGTHTAPYKRNWNLIFKSLCWYAFETIYTENRLHASLRESSHQDRVLLSTAWVIQDIPLLHTTGFYWGFATTKYPTTNNWNRSKAQLFFL